MGGLVGVTRFPYKGRPVQMWSRLVCSSSPSRIWNGRWNRHGYRIQEQARRIVMWGVKGDTRRQCRKHCRQKTNGLQPAQCMCIHQLTAWTLRRERQGVSAWVQCGGRGSLDGCTYKEEASWVNDKMSEWQGTDTKDRAARHWHWQQSDKGLTLILTTEWQGSDNENRVTRD